MRTIDGFNHEWVFDLPWHMVNLKDWLYMVNVGYIEPTIFLHVRIFGVRSLWTFTHLTPLAVDDAGLSDLMKKITEEISSAGGVPLKYWHRR